MERSVEVAIALLFMETDEDMSKVFDFVANVDKKPVPVPYLKLVEKE